MKLSRATSLVYLLLELRHSEQFVLKPKISGKCNLRRTKLQSSIQKEDIVLFNSLTRNKEPFKASDLINKNRVSMYTCGPTVYDHAHIGNFRAFLTYDVLKRVLQYFGYEVKHICNLTDIDDKIIARCNREKVSLLELTRKYENLFMEDLAALNIIPANKYPRATEHIDEMVEFIKDLENAGLAYQSDEGSWYFDVAKKEGYGKQLVNLDVKNMMPSASSDGGGNMRGTDADEYDADKVGVRDFALWKAYKPNFDRDDAVWETSIGKGRPGWHLECSAMARKYLGDSTIDIHCGGVDLKFPHHENEIAQSEGANSGNKFCNCWLHNGFVNIGEEKMSKSKGNFLTLRTACTKPDDIRAYRYLIVSSQYRNPLTFSQKVIDASKSALKRIDKVRLQISDILSSKDEDEIVYSPTTAFFDNHDVSPLFATKSQITLEVKKHLLNFNLALVDDLSTPRAAASLFAVVKLAESHFKQIKKLQDNNKDEDNNSNLQLLYDLEGIRAIQYALLQMDQIFGIFYTVPDALNGEEEEETSLIVPNDVMELVLERVKAKEAKEWELADTLRNKVTELGFSIKDVKESDPLVTRLE